MVIDLDRSAIMNEDSYILVTMISKYEIERLLSLVRGIDPTLRHRRRHQRTEILES